MPPRQHRSDGRAQPPLSGQGSCPLFTYIQSLQRSLHHDERSLLIQFRYKKVGRKPGIFLDDSCTADMLNQVTESRRQDRSLYAVLFIQYGYFEKAWISYGPAPQTVLASEFGHIQRKSPDQRSGQGTRQRGANKGLNLVLSLGTRTERLLLHQPMASAG